MKSNCQIRKEAWDILGKWFWRLLIAGLILQAVAYAANSATVAALDHVGITTAGEFLAAKLRAASQGLAYTLPTTKAYFWMAAGFLLQTFITYVFSAICAFGFGGLLLKARANNTSRWLADAMSGFSRPLDVTWLLILMNILICLVACAWAGLIGLGVAACAHFALWWFKTPTGILTMAACGCVGMLFALPMVYAYRQAWFLKCEDPSRSAVDCLRTSRKMMKGAKMDAFLLDFSFVGWLALSCILYIASSAISRFAGANIVTMVVAGAIGLVAFYILIRSILGMFVARAVFYHELQVRVQPSAQPAIA